jgi:DNA invertase Pin-like site-specific DNA recombinase
LKAAGTTRIFADKQSGNRSDQPQLKKALAALGEGDTLIVTRLDRLARSTRDLLNVLHEIGLRRQPSLRTLWPYGRRPQILRRASDLSMDGCEA